MERMHLIAQTFFIDTQHHEAAFETLIGGEAALMEDYESLAGLMAASGWPVELDAEGNIVGIRFDDETRSGLELRFFAALAPFVRAGSLILCLEDDTGPILWTFDGARVSQAIGEAVARQIATILSHALVPAQHNPATLADRIAARVRAYQALTATLAETYRDMPDAYAPDDPEAQADALERSSDEETALLAQVRSLEQQIATLHRELAAPLYVVVDAQGPEINSGDIAVFTTPAAAEAAAAARMRDHAGLDETDGDLDVETACAIDGYVVEVLTVTRPRAAFPEPHPLTFDDVIAPSSTRVSATVRADHTGVVIEILDRQGYEAASVVVEVHMGRVVVHTWDTAQVGNDPDTTVLVADLTHLNRSSS